MACIFAVGVASYVVYRWYKRFKEEQDSIRCRPSREMVSLAEKPTKEALESVPEPPKPKQYENLSALEAVLEARGVETHGETPREYATQASSRERGPRDESDEMKEARRALEEDKNVVVVKAGSDTDLTLSGESSVEMDEERPKIRKSRRKKRSRRRGPKSEKRSTRTAKEISSNEGVVVNKK